MKKFYKKVTWGPAPGGYAIRLDEDLLRTPAGRAVVLPSGPLTAAVAQEWTAQGDVIRPATMPMMRLTNTMIDKSQGQDRAAVTAEMVKYGGSDLVCYFAEKPEELIRQQQACWLPLLEWMKERYGIVYETVSGIQYRQQPKESLDRLEKTVAALPPLEFTLLQAAAMTTGSVVIALALLEGTLTPEEAYAAACVDETYQLKTWGEDTEARRRLEALRSELGSIARFMELARG